MNILDFRSLLKTLGRLIPTLLLVFIFMTVILPFIGYIMGRFMEQNAALVKALKFPGELWPWLDSFVADHQLFSLFIMVAIGLGFTICGFMKNLTKGC